ncbi:hypothetical protein TNCV_2443031 [Trichonephila clavipes]|nr:hypothetical protein TNCV_2443031 [Trichonephila clavipes]
MYEGRLERGTFRSENEYLDHYDKTIVITWRLLLVYIDITPPQCESSKRGNQFTFLPCHLIMVLNSRASLLCDVTKTLTPVIYDSRYRKDCDSR